MKTIIYSFIVLFSLMTWGQDKSKPLIVSSEKYYGNPEGKNEIKMEEMLNGIWISAYQYKINKRSSYELPNLPFNLIWEFKNEKLNIQSFKYKSSGDIQSYKFKLKGNRLVLNNRNPNSARIIEPITKDSFELSGFRNGLTKLVFKRLDDSLKNSTTNFKLIGNKYIRKFKKLTDTIHFVNEYDFKLSSWKQGEDLIWKRGNYKGFDIIFTNTFAPSIIKKKVENKIYLTTLGKKQKNYFLEQIE